MSATEYRNDPRVHFAPGHPVLREAMPELMEGLGVRFEGHAAMRWQQFQRRAMRNLEYGSMAHKVATVAAPPAFASAAAPGGLPGVSALARRDKEHEAEARR